MINKANNYIIQGSDIDKLLKLVIEKDLENFKATRGRFLNNNPNTKAHGKLFA